MVVDDKAKLTLLGIGHPLLDISVDVDNELLNKYELKSNDAILGEKKHESIVDVLFDQYQSKIRLLAGGSVLNTIRIAQWVFEGLSGQGQARFFGAVGQDKYGELLVKQSIEDKVQPLFVRMTPTQQIIDVNNNSINKEKNNKTQVKKENKSITYRNNDWQTGVCVALNTCNGQNRSMIAFLGAARSLNAHHVEQHSVAFQQATAIYTSGFLLGSSADAIWKMIQKRQVGQLFTFNLSAPYVCSVFGKQLWQLLPHLDILFGNKEELQAFAKFNEWPETEIPQIVEKILQELKQKANKSDVKLDIQFVITEDKNPILVLSDHLPKNGLAFPIPLLPSNELVDTIGAGDAFVGGFLAKRLLNQPLLDCVQTGIYCARRVISVSGCQMNGQYEQLMVNRLFESQVKSTKQSEGSDEPEN